MALFATFPLRTFKSNTTEKLQWNALWGKTLQFLSSDVCFVDLELQQTEDGSTALPQPMPSSKVQVEYIHVPTLKLNHILVWNTQTYVLRLT